jgi:hypothetical protein
MTLAQCRVNDTTCPISKEIAAKVVKEVHDGISAKPAPSPVAN